MKVTRTTIPKYLQKQTIARQYPKYCRLRLDSVMFDQPRPSPNITKLTGSQQEACFLMKGC